jgi:hypothetical protein
MHIAYVNQSTLVSDAQAAAMAEACVNQVNYHAAPLWGSRGITGGFYRPNAIPAGAFAMYFFDNADQAGALGYHTEDPNGSIYGRVFVKDTMNGGGAIMDGPGSVCSVTSHETLELWQDQTVNKWAMGPDGLLYAWEIGDPVESDWYRLSHQYGGGYVSVSNFALQPWFDASPAPGAKFDYLGRLTKPFTMTPGGYVVYATMGQEQQKFAATAPNKLISHGERFSVVAHFGDEYPRHKISGKTHPAARTMRRLARVLSR